MARLLIRPGMFAVTCYLIRTHPRACREGGHAGRAARRGAQAGPHNHLIQILIWREFSGLFGRRAGNARAFVAPAPSHELGLARRATSSNVNVVSLASVSMVLEILGIPTRRPRGGGTRGRARRRPGVRSSQWRSTLEFFHARPRSRLWSRRAALQGDPLEVSLGPGRPPSSPVQRAASPWRPQVVDSLGASRGVRCACPPRRPAGAKVRALYARHNPFHSGRFLVCSGSRATTSRSRRPKPMRLDRRRYAFLTATRS